MIVRRREVQVCSASTFIVEGKAYGPQLLTGSLSGSQMVREQMETALWKPLLSPFEFALNLLMNLGYFGLTDAIKRDVTRLAGTTPQCADSCLRCRLGKSGMIFWWSCKYLSNNLQ